VSKSTLVVTNTTNAKEEKEDGSWRTNHRWVTDVRRDSVARFRWRKWLRRRMAVEEFAMQFLTEVRMARVGNAMETTASRHPYCNIPKIQATNKMNFLYSKFGANKKNFKCVA
jgi:hypothetical protein